MQAARCTSLQLHASGIRSGENVNRGAIIHITTQRLNSIRTLSVLYSPLKNICSRTHSIPLIFLRKESFIIRSTKRVQGTSFTPTAKSQPTYKYNADIQHQLHFSDSNGPRNRLFNKSSRWTACRAQKPTQYRSSLIRSCAYSSLNNAKDLFSKEGKLQPYLCIAACLV